MSVALELSRREDAEHSFTRFMFEKLGIANANPLQGSGVGLYMSQALTSLIGSEITFGSALGDGSRFALDVPGSAS